MAKRLAAVGDISCDIGGGLEFVTRATTIDAPSYDVNGVSVMAVDILPASLPRDASVHFSERLLRYVRSIVDDYKGVKGGDVEAADALKRATIASGGQLQKGHEWLTEKVDAWRVTQGSRTENKHTTSDFDISPEDNGRSRAVERKKRVLVLGSGMVAGPAVDELAARLDVELIVGKSRTRLLLAKLGREHWSLASNSLQEAERLVSSHPNASAFLITIEDRTRLSQLVKETDVVIR
jgi:alpha-aminoadipic semialdehyde synthase